MPPARPPIPSFARPRAAWPMLLLVVLVWLAPGARGADPLAAGFDQANQLYERGQYSEAAIAYAKLLQTGTVSAPLYFNLGNACFKAGQVGQALLNYRYAERLAPRDPDIQANLRFARGQVQGGSVPAGPFWRRWLPRLSLDRWAWLAAALLWTWLGLLTAVQFRPAWRLWLKRTLLVLGAAFLAAGAGSFLTWRDQCLVRHAVVVQRDAILRHGPLTESPSLQTLRDGQELVVLDQKDTWLQVAGASRGIGWIPSNHVALLKP